MLNSKVLQHPEPAYPISRTAPPVAVRNFGPVPSQFASASADQNAFRKLAFWATAALVFVRVGMLPETLYAAIGFNTYLLYIFTPPAMLGALFAGGIGRTLQHRAGWLWLGFFCCVLMSLPFSSWQGGSVADFKAFTEFSFPFLFLAGGAAVNWREVRTLFSALAAGGLVFVASARFLASSDGGRVEIKSNSTIGNPNDLASHMIFVLPFLLYVALDKRKPAAIRYLMAVPAAFGIWIIFGTASRGGLIAMGVAFLFALIRSSAKQRIGALAVVILLGITIPLFLHGNAADRLASMFGEGEHREAQMSQDSRSYLLRMSIEYTFHHPIFGVGLGQFANYEGGAMVASGQVGNWHETHNAFTEVSSECGIPAALFFTFAIVSAMAAVNRIYRRARKEGYTEIANTCFCYLLSMVGYLTSIVFLSNAFRFYLPIMIGLAGALTVAAQREMAKSIATEPVRFSGMSPVPRRTRPVLP
jgi:O-antigen ligase